MSTNPAINEFDFLVRHSLMAFVEYTFAELFPQTPFSDSSHLAIIAAKLEECATGKCKRLIICLPPRSLKSVIASVAFPAWVLGKCSHKRAMGKAFQISTLATRAQSWPVLVINVHLRRAYPNKSCPSMTS